MKPVMITADSTCDLSLAILEEYQIRMIPFHIICGETTYLDGVNIQPADIYNFVKKTGQLPKTGAPGIEAYAQFFRQFTDHYDVIHFCISEKLSSGPLYAAQAAKEVPGVAIVDSLSLSTGTALLAVKAAIMAKEGKSQKEIVAAVQPLIHKVQASFVVDTLEYLHKGGRCSGLELFGANLLRLHPVLLMLDGEIKVTEKLRGNMTKVFDKYAEYLLERFPNADKSFAFVTHTECDTEIVSAMKEIVIKKFGIKKVYETVAGGTIACHCGQGTLGILFLSEKDVY